MKIVDLDSAHDVEKPADIATVLSKRHGVGAIHSGWVRQLEVFRPSTSL